MKLLIFNIFIFYFINFVFSNEINFKIKIKEAVKDELIEGLNNEYDIPYSVYEKTADELLANPTFVNPYSDIVYFILKGAREGKIDNKKSKRQYLVPYSWWTEKSTCEIECDSIAVAGTILGGNLPIIAIPGLVLNFYSLGECYKSC